MAAAIDRTRPRLSVQALTIADFLEVDDCYDKLASKEIGRILFSQGALPVMTPARYAVNGRDLYLLTGPNAEQHAGISGAVIAFEVDDLDPCTGSGWTVTVTGIAEACTHPSRWPLVARLGLAPLDGHWACVFRLRLGIVSGRRFATRRSAASSRPERPS